jgi:hypothetical protein
MSPSKLRGAMDGKMTHTVRAELADAIRLRYRSATGKQKRRILDEFVARTGYHEKSAIRALNGQPVTKRRQTRAHPSLYDEGSPWRPDPVVGGLRSSLRQASEGLVADFAARFGAQRTCEAR